MSRAQVAASLALNDPHVRRVMAALLEVNGVTQMTVPLSRLELPPCLDVTWVQAPGDNPALHVEFTDAAEAMRGVAGAQRGLQVVPLESAEEGFATEPRRVPLGSAVVAFLALLAIAAVVVPLGVMLWRAAL